MADPHRRASIHTAPSATTTDVTGRWGIALAGVVMQIALGAVYAWSVFRIPLTKTFGWTISQVTLAFTLAILMLGFAAFGVDCGCASPDLGRLRSPRASFMVLGFSSQAFLADTCTGSISRTAFWEALA